MTKRRKMKLHLKKEERQQGWGSLPVYSKTLTGKNPFFEEMANPEKYPSGLMGLSKKRNVSTTIRRFLNQRLLNVDGRFARDIDYLFAAQYAAENKQVKSDVGIRLRQTRGTFMAGGNVTAGIVKDDTKIQEIIRKDQAFKSLKNVRGSPAYWQKTL
ncbi:hypothetical protein HOLleu_01246 [Holothuria leucospilota]|uniref:Uncharacterized protein n=1 Tax=Holothuria leucospilota TaxID=206669 RepID=A0A9Q1CNS7_HOLLE|nr:hypothetical protein HOLleu_01246 [Holothuria leucospilota]